jgi:putative transposase
LHPHGKWVLHYAFGLACVYVGCQALRRRFNALRPLQMPRKRLAAFRQKSPSFQPHGAAEGTGAADPLCARGATTLAGQWWRPLLPFVPLALYLTHATHHLTKSDVTQRSNSKTNMDGARIVTKRRHTASEIAKKLAMADEMTAQGRLQGDIAKSLGISLMTYHRWRKARGALVRAAVRPVAEAGRIEVPPEREQLNQIRELQLENSRLRRLVTDLLLEKVKLEEGLRTTPVARRTLAHG